jgi:hypothetical protein
VSLQATIRSLADRGWSGRRIARELGLNRETVGRYLGLAKPAISTTGFEEGCEAKPAISTAGSIAGRKSQCEPLAEAIIAKIEIGLSAQRIEVSRELFGGSQALLSRFAAAKVFRSHLRTAFPLAAASPQTPWLGGNRLRASLGDLPVNLTRSACRP